MSAVCKQCRYFKNREPGSVREHVWYNHVCVASPLPTAIDPYDGKEKPFNHNSLGGKYFTDQPYQFCREINKDGECHLYETKERVWG